MKLKCVIVILFIFLSVIPMTLLGVAHMYYYNQKLETVLENDLKNAVSTQIKAIEVFLDERKVDAAVIIQYQPVQELLSTSKSSDSSMFQQIGEQKMIELIHDLLFTRTENNRYIDTISILDRNFQTLASSDSSLVGQISNIKDLDEKYLDPTMQFSSVTEIQRNGQTQNVIEAVQEIYADEELIGYLVYDLNLSYFEEIRVSASLFNNGTIYMIDGKGQIIAAGDTQEMRREYVLSPKEQKNYMDAWNSRDTNSTKGVIKYTALGDHYMSCYTVFSQTDWHMLSSINVDEVLQTKKAYRDLIVIITATLIVLLIAISYFLSRFLAKPIHNMIEKFGYIKEKRDYAIRMNVKGKDEISTISKEINSLLSSIENYMQLEKLEQEKLKEKAQRDPLTGLYNKDTFEQLLRLELDKANSEHRQIACLFFDIDDFKNFNTLYGHTGGDQVLKFIAKTIEENIHGFAGRQGGDEFAACITEATTTPAISINMDELEKTLKQIVALLNQGFVCKECTEKIPIYCSIGVAFSDVSNDPIHCISYEELLTRSDEAMYEIKHNGKNGYCIWQEKKDTNKKA